MSDFNPFESEFNFDVDPVTADQRGLAILDKLDQGKALQKTLGGRNPILGIDLKEKEEKLLKNLERYRTYKTKRGEDLFSHETEAIARSKGGDEETIARQTVKIFQADKETFDSYLEEQGDANKYKRWNAFMPPGVSLQKRYLLRKTMQSFGFADSEIKSGFAEPQFRAMIGAGDHEPTEDAALRWGLDRVNVYDRRRKVAQAAAELASTRFLGMTVDKDTFDDALAEANPDLTDEERTQARGIRALQLEKMNKDFKEIRPLVRKAFNTIAIEEGITSDFTDPEDAPFENLGEAVAAMQALPKEKFPMVVAMLAQTAKAHGKDVDGFMNKVGESFSRGVGSLLAGTGVSIAGNVANEIQENAKRRENETFRDVQDWFADLLGVKEKVQAVSDNSEEVSEEIMEMAFYASELTNWKDSVAKVGSDNRFVNDWVYGTVGSLPEMIGAFTGAPGIAFIANAQAGRNLSDLKREHPELDLADARKIANTGGLAYSLLNRLEGKILFSKLPATGSLTSKITKRFVTALGFETLQEMAQEGTFPLAKKLFHAVDSDMPNVDLLGAEGEFTKIAEMAPDIAFQAVPLVALGVGGRMAVEYFDRRSLKRLLSDKKYLREIGIPPIMIQNINKMGIDEAADYIQENKAKWMEEVNETLDVEPDTFKSPAWKIQKFAASVNFNGSDGTFTVNGKDQAVTARSPEEAAMAEKAMKAESKSSNLPTSTENRTVDPQATDPNQEVFHSMFAPGFAPDFAAGESKSRRKDALPPVPDEKTGVVTERAKRRFGLQSFFGQRDVPSKTLQRSLTEGQRKAAGAESQFNEIAKSLDARMKRHVKRQPKTNWDAEFKNIQKNAFLALRGDKAAMKALPKRVRRVVEQGRESIDAYTQELIDTGAVNPELTQVLGNNIGSYVTREFKVFDPKAKWNYQTVKAQHADIYNKALKYIVDTQGVSAKEADTIIRGMLDSSKSQGFLSGNGKIGKVNVSNFIKRKDIADPILDLLGEVRNPVINIRNTGQKVSKIAITNATQAHMAEQMVAAGLASRQPNPDKRHTERLGEESYTYPGIDKDTGEPAVFHGTRTAKAFAGFGTLYLEPELHGPLMGHFDPGRGAGKKSGFQIAFDGLAKITGIGKFAQVILNPAAYPTNFLGGVATEIFNGRVSLDGRGRKAYTKFGSLRNFGKMPKEPYGVKEQADFYAMTGKDFQKAGGVNKLGRNQLNTEMEQQGIRDNSVFAEDLNETIEKGYGPAAAKASRAASKAYQAADNAAKRSAFVHELDKWMQAEPDSNMDVLVQKAAEDVRKTTQNYDMVPAILKSFSQRGIIVPTYISFSFELFRNTINTMKLASQEIRSGNPVLAKAGWSRVAGMMVIGGLLYALNEMVSQWMTGMEDDEREKLRAALPPWLEDSEVVFLGADENSLAYFDASYLIPHQVFYNAVSRATKMEAATETVTQSAKSLFAPVGSLNIFNQTAAEVLTNKKRGGGQIYNPEITPEGSIGWVREAGAHFFDSMFTPGVERTRRKMMKAKEGEVGFAGSTATMDDIYLGLFGIRPYRMDTSSEKFLEDNLLEYSFRSREAKSHTSDRKQSRRTEEEKADAEEAVTQAQKKMLDEFSASIRMFKTLNISNERIYQAVQAASVPRYMKAELPILLGE